MSFGIRVRHPLLPVGMEVEIDVIDRTLVAVAVDEEQARAADPLDRRDVELAVALADLDVGRAELSARSCAAFASLTRNAIAQALGPWSRA